MKARTEELLYQLLWTCDQALHPTFRNVTGTFEQWAYRNGLSRQLSALAKRKLLELEPGPDCSERQTGLSRAIRLTKAGRLQALGGRDPETCWNRRWDGRWRLAVFDIPNEETRMRDRLRRYFRQHGFGCLQQSVWITPHPISQEKELLAEAKVDVKSLILMEARPCAGETDAEIVAGAWDFERLQKRYSEYREVLGARPRAPLNSESAAKALQTWVRQEQAAWLRAATLDPFLPNELLPKDYPGKTAWRERAEVIRKAGALMRGFAPTPTDSNQS